MEGRGQVFLWPLESRETLQNNQFPPVSRIVLFPERRNLILVSVREGRFSDLQSVGVTRAVVQNLNTRLPYIAPVVRHYRGIDTKNHSER